jgi:large subunit ribosomal protein L18
MPRLTVFKSNKHFYAQAVDDTTGTTLVSVDGRKLGLKSNREDVKKVAQELGKNLASKNIETVAFDRNGYLYHGVVASFAEALREAGIKF